MGETERYQEYKTSKPKFTLGQSDNALYSLFALNIIFFFLILLSRVFFLYTHQGQGAEAPTTDGLQWFALSGSVKNIITRPWTIITFMFSNGGAQPIALLFTMFSNMLWLWAFGYILQDLSGNRYIFPIYIYGSLLAALFFIIAINVMPTFKPNASNYFLYGSQMGTIALSVAAACFFPNYRLLKNIGSGIPVWLFTVLYLLINFGFAISTSTAISIAIFGAALSGFLFIKILHNGVDLGSWMHNSYNKLSNLFNPNKTKKEIKIKEKIFYETGNRKPFNKTANVTQQRIDEILDKISEHGFNYLSSEDKNILKRASEEDI